MVGSVTAGLKTVLCHALKDNNKRLKKNEKLLQEEGEERKKEREVEGKKVTKLLQGEE